MNEKTLGEARLKIAGFLKNRRLELGLTQKEVAQRTGMARETINRMEQGFFWLGMKQFLLICEALHLVPDITEIRSSEDIAGRILKAWDINA
ncbi:MAG: helix-turn-helix transcriptional regulator [Sphingobacteriales bacterium]|jgi:transcriptional regulator with XRE-family HTH domain|nr:helix-turn-helix transcriptional regulator [Sphingobacteriales bacterium]